MDLIKAIGKRAGFEKVTVKGMGFDALIPALDAGNIDVAIALHEHHRCPEAEGELHRSLL